jgi:hypothetical protein
MATTTEMRLCADVSTTRGVARCRRKGTRRLQTREWKLGAELRSMVTSRMAGGYGALLEFLTTIIPRANAANVLRSSMPARLYVYETLLERLAQHFQDVVPALWEFFQAIHAGMRATPGPASAPVRRRSGQPA